MLQYNEKNKTDPNTLKYALKCGYGIISIMIIAGLLFSLSRYIVDGYESFSNMFVYGFSSALLFISEIGKSVNKTAIIYIMWSSMALVMWSLCVMLKIKQDCQKSKKLLKRLNLTFLLISTVLTLFTIYIIFNDESLFLIKAIITCWICMTTIEALSYISDDCAYRQYHGLES